MSVNYQGTSFIEILRHLYRRKFIIAGITLVVSMVVAVISLFMEEEYKSRANLLPAEERGIGIDAFSAGGATGAASALLGREDQRFDRFYVLLRSRNINKQVVEEFDLIEVYETGDTDEPMNKAIQVLRDNTSFEGLEEGNFLINTWDTDPQRAHDMAQFYIEKLNELNTEISVREASEYRQFVEQRYEQSLEDIDELRNQLKEMQQEYGLYDIETQLASYFDLIGEVTVNVLQSEVRLDLLDQSVSEHNKAYIRAMREFESLQRKLSEVYADDQRDNILLNINELPEAISEYLYLEQSLELQRQIQEFILPAYEQAKMEEIKAIPSVSVVDEPEVAPVKDRPRRSLIVILTFISTLLLSVFGFIGELVWKNNQELIDYLRS